MFDRSRAHIFVAGADVRAASLALDRWYRKWGQRRFRGDASKLGSEPVKDWLIGTHDRWTVLLPEDVSEAIEIAYKALNAADPEVAVLVSVAWKSPTRDWHLKAYHQRDVLFKHGDDPDHELAWIGRPLDKSRIKDVQAVLGDDPALHTFLEGVIAGRPDPRDLRDGLGLPSLAIGFQEQLSAADPAWQRHTFIDANSPWAQ